MLGVRVATAQEPQPDFRMARRLAPNGYDGANLGDIRVSRNRPGNTFGRKVSFTETMDMALDALEAKLKGGK